VLGPRGGPYEVLEASPLDEYLTGVLQPAGVQIPEPGSEVDRLPGEMEAGEEDLEEMEIAPAVFTPALDPRMRASSMGLSFQVRMEGEDPPRLAACVSWARYMPEGDGEEAGSPEELAGRQGRRVQRWRRHPRCHVLDPLRAGDHYLDAQGPAQPDRAEIEISLHVQMQARGPGVFQVRIQPVNRIRPQKSDRVRTEECIFQPGIRVVCGEETRLEPAPPPGGREDPEERRLDFLYRDRPVKARGHLVSAVWREIDPERPAPHPAQEAERPDGPPFVWVDGVLLDENERCRFSPPDVRTEFLPVYALHAPDREWDSRYGPAPELEAGRLAALAADPAALRRALEPLIRGYKDWIREQEEKAEALHGESREEAKDVLRECRTALERMRAGLELLESDPDVPLSFAFVCQAMALQARWAGRELRWRPFQLAFLLMNLPGVARPDLPDRRICDLLWVPTGGGKTEAYLALAAFAMALRRRKALQRGRAGAGVAVLSRYTLRLLTIQQFRRALAMVAACERLRVDGLRDGRPVGWRPPGWPDRRDFLWGSVPFRIGLLVGGGLTPNRLASLPRSPGALEILEGRRGEGEPAQILKCPACGAWLAVPDDGLPPGEHELHLICRPREDPPPMSQIEQLAEGRGSGFRASLSCTAAPLSGSPCLTITFRIRTDVPLRPEALDRWWREGPGQALELIPFRPSRPGYFPVQVPKARAPTEHRLVDFEIWCPAPGCPLTEEWWCEGVPADRSALGRFGARGGRVGLNRARPGTDQLAHPSRGDPLALPDGMVFRTMSGPWSPPDPAAGPFLAGRIPVPALTVDEQIYRRLPAMVVATVDKFARLPFEPEAGAVFGTVGFYQAPEGYFREPTAMARAVKVPLPDPPDLVLQDELHLIEGPLGSLAGLYETAIDFLCLNGEAPAKYAAATATIRAAAAQVRSLFLREVQIFPPPGLRAGDRFFMRALREPHPLEEKQAGQLYAGVCAPGRGPLTPIYRIWACLLQQVHRRRDYPDPDFFRTLVGYFNAIRELAGVLALYRQDIPQRIRDAWRASGDLRQLDREPLELSSRTPSTRLPAVLEQLGTEGPEAPDALLATSMFGTGVDIPRLSLMVVHGQPRTTGACIQATGRVGRRRGALVVVFLRASRPRDLSHYEFFCGYHRQLHRHVEPATALPFSPGAMDLALGPVMVALLRHRRDAAHPWHRDETAQDMANRRLEQEVTGLTRILRRRAEGQPDLRRPPPDSVERLAEPGLDRWAQLARQHGSRLACVDYAIQRPPRNPVVPGDPEHRQARLPAVFENVPQSMRDVEETIDFEAQEADMGRQSVRISQAVLVLGPGAILESRSGPRMILRDGLRLPSHLRLEDLEISSPELRGLLAWLLEREVGEAVAPGSIRIFQVPSSAGTGGLRWETRPFPDWKLCIAHQILHRRGCPDCRQEGRSSGRQAEAIRFVRACPEGHLDDVDLDLLVHGQNPPLHSSDHYRWESRGSSLSDIRIRCPRCRKDVSLGWAWGQPWPCSGRFPEREAPDGPPDRPGCGSRAFIIQRQASNLRVPEVFSLFTIPPPYTELHRLLQRPGVREALIPQNVIPDGRLHRKNLEQALDHLVSPGDLDTAERDSILECPDQEIARAITDVLEYQPPSDFAQLLRQEFQQFLRGARDGIPPVQAPPPRSRILLEIHPGFAKPFPPFQVVPVLRLTVVTVQVGYRRQVGGVPGQSLAGRLVDVSIRDGTGNRWFPGYEGAGEGLLILRDCHEDGWEETPAGVASQSWIQARAGGMGDARLFRGPERLELHPVFVAWHTLSHLLIRALAVDSGYVAPSIRERVYLEEGHDDRRVRGGILLYTASRGAGGSLGGLLALVPVFDRIIERAKEIARVCPADPLCREHRFRMGEPVGAACHGCCPVSETSCEHRNLWLDRNVLTEIGWL